MQVFGARAAGRLWPTVAVIVTAACGCNSLDRPTLAPAGEPCSEDADCASGRCATEADDPVCASSCSSDCDCPSSYACTDGLCLPGTNRCPTACGTCDDGNDCTADSCGAEGRCEHDPEPDDTLGCRNELFVNACQQGSEEMVSCPELCVDGDYNAVLPCTRQQCQCTDYDEPCTVGSNSCVTFDDGTTGLATCVDGGDYEADTDFWYARTCQRVCEEGGWDAATGECGMNEAGDNYVCYCR